MRAEQHEPMWLQIELNIPHEPDEGPDTLTWVRQRQDLRPMERFEEVLARPTRSWTHSGG
jgi:hypothetical protein